MTGPSARLPRAGERWRCAGCGNLTRFDVVRTRRTREFWHVDLAGAATVDDEQTLEEQGGGGQVPLVRAGRRHRVRATPLAAPGP